MIPKTEQAHWALQEAAIKTEINQAKTNFDLLRMANAVARLGKLHSEMEAAGKSTSGHNGEGPTSERGWGALIPTQSWAKRSQFWLCVGI